MKSKTFHKCFVRLSEAKHRKLNDKIKIKKLSPLQSTELIFSEIQVLLPGLRWSLQSRIIQELLKIVIEKKNTKTLFRL
jgi:hypothetical protein